MSDVKIESESRNPKYKGKISKSSSLVLPIPVEEIKKEKEVQYPSTFSTSQYSPRKIMKSSKNRKQNKMEFRSCLPITVEKIKQEKEDPPTKFPSKKSKRNKLEQERQKNLSGQPILVENIKLEKEDPPSKKSKNITEKADQVEELQSTLPVPVENIKLEKEESTEIVYMHFHPTPENVKIEKDEDESETETIDSKKTSKIKKRREETQEPQLDFLSSESKTSKLLPCPMCCRKAFWTAKSLKKHLEKGHTQCKIPGCLKFIPPYETDMNRHLKLQHPKEYWLSRLTSKSKKGQMKARRKINKWRKRTNLTNPTNPQTLFTCGFKSCGLEFSTGNNRDQHMQKVHLFFQCEIPECGAKYLTLSALKSHRNQHIF